MISFMLALALVGAIFIYNVKTAQFSVRNLDKLSVMARELVLHPEIPANEKEKIISNVKISGSFWFPFFMLISSPLLGVYLANKRLKQKKTVGPLSATDSLKENFSRQVALTVWSGHPITIMLAVSIIGISMALTYFILGVILSHSVDSSDVVTQKVIDNKPLTVIERIVNATLTHKLKFTVN